MRMTAVEVGQARNQPVAEQRGNDRQTQLGPVAAPARGGRCGFDRHHGRLYRLQVVLSCCGQRIASAQALEQGKAQMLLKPGNGPADAALRHIQLLRGERVTAQAGRSGKGVKFGQGRRVHAHDGLNYDGW